MNVNLGQTNADGTLQIADVPVGNYAVTAQLNGYTVVASKLVAVRSKGADITELNLEYDKGMLTGQVQLAEAAACPK